MSEDLPSLPPDIEALLRRTQGHPGPPADVRAALRSRLAPVLAPPPLPPPAHAPRLGPVGRVLANRIVVAAAAFGAGSGVTAWHYSHLPAYVQVVTPTAPLQPAATPAPLAPVAAPAAVPPAAPVHHRSVATPGPAPVPTPARVEPTPEGRDAQLAMERTLVETGRTALTRGDAAGALRAADEHARRFPDGQLVEEREALRIQALAAETRRAEAETDLQRFHERFPKSLIFQALRRELDSTK